MRANSGSFNLLLNNINCLKNMAKQRHLYNGEQSLGRLDFLKNSETEVLCWTFLVTSSNRWRKTRWSGLWEFIGQQKTLQFMQITLTTGKMRKQRRLYNGEILLGAIENGSAVLDTPGGLRPTGGGKPSGLGCGSS